MKYKSALLLSIISSLMILLFFLKKEYFERPIIDAEYIYYINTNTSFQDLKLDIESLSNELSYISKLGLTYFLQQQSFISIY